MRSLIEDPEHGDGKGILNPAGKIALTGDADNHLGSLVQNNLSREGPPCGHSHGNLISLRKLNQALDFAFSAGFAVLHISRDPDAALMVLKALGKQDEELVGRDKPCLCENQLVVDRDERPLNLLLPDTDALAHKHEQGEQETDNDPTDSPIEEEILPPDDRENEGEAPANQKHDHQGEQNSHNQREMGVDTRKADVRNQPKGHRNHHQSHARQEKEQNENPLLKPVVHVRLSHLTARSGVFCHHFPSNVPSGMGNPLRKASAASLFFPGYWSSLMPILPWPVSISSRPCW